MRPITRPKSLSATVLDGLRQSIVEGDLELGQPLSERQLAESFGVSKTPVREALAQLRLEGLVRIVPQRGAFVFTLSAREVMNMCELRLTLEATALRLAFERERPGLVKGLTVIVRDMEAARQGRNMRSYLNADTAYHQVFFRNCGNPLLADTYRIYLGKIAAVRTHLVADDLVKTLGILDRHIERTKTTYAETVEDIAAADKNAGKAA
jgi:DNA-binding GntR family transcriptional regulator